MLRKSSGQDGFRENARSPAHFANVVIIGETGVGKSSLINLITNGSAQARTSNNVVPCTKKSHACYATIDGRTFKIWDTVGLDSAGWIRPWIEKKKLRRFLLQMLERKELGLLVYCMRGSRATKAIKAHYQTFCSKVRGAAVPVVVVVTCLEKESGDLENWWNKNGDTLSSHGLIFDGHACVTTLRDNSGDVRDLQEKFSSSYRAVRTLIFQKCLPRT
ncbi:P-loop containing nucleoside triphosphate hydrolase protein [Scleroderma yunnanense]